MSFSQIGSWLHTFINNPIISRNWRQQKKWSFVICSEIAEGIKYSFILGIVLFNLGWLGVFFYHEPQNFTPQYLLIESQKFIQFLCDLISVIINRFPTWTRFGFTRLVYLLPLLLSLLMPLPAAINMAQERQQHTLDLLRVTVLTAPLIVLSKWLGNMFMGLQLIGLSMLLTLPSWLIGGIPPRYLFIFVLVLLTTVLTYTILGLTTALWSKTVTKALLYTYGVSLPMVVIGPPMLLSLLQSTLYILQLDYNIPWVEALVSALNPLMMLSTSWQLLEFWDGNFIHYPTILPVPPWSIYIGSHLLLSGLLFYLASRRLETL